MQPYDKMSPSKTAASKKLDDRQPSDAHVPNASATRYKAPTLKNSIIKGPVIRVG